MGYTLEVFRIGDMVQDALSDLPKGIVNIQLDDETAPAGERALYPHQARVSDGPADEKQLAARRDLYVRASFDIPGRQWSLLISPTPEFFAAYGTWQARGALAGGLLITALMVAYLISMIHHTAKTQRLTADLSRSNEGLRTEITERRRLEEALASIGDAVEFLDVQGNIQFVNKAFEEIFGCRSEDVLGKSVTLFTPADPASQAQSREILRQTYEQGSWRGEVKRVRKNGEEFDSSLTVATVTNGEGRVAGLVGVAQDITERKRAAQQIEAALKEKEVLLSEIHHRVKNNLEIVSSLLDLQSSNLVDERALRLLRSSQNRIRSMALIHEKLYQSEALSRIYFGDYLRSLVADLYSLYGVSPDAIKLKIYVNHILLGIDSAIPRRMIINELVSNSLQHAFPADGHGEISIAFRLDDDNQYRLTVGDNGVGFPEGLDFRNTKSLGLKLVYALAVQLKGTIELDRSCGTSFEITFEAR